MTRRARIAHEDTTTTEQAGGGQFDTLIFVGLGILLAGVLVVVLAVALA